MYGVCRAEMSCSFVENMIELDVIEHTQDTLIARPQQDLVVLVLYHPSYFLVSEDSQLSPHDSMI
jgi:hypothetical protein